MVSVSCATAKVRANPPHWISSEAAARAHGLETKRGAAANLIARQLPVAAVTGIRGNVRHRTNACIGEAGHSEAVPPWLRRGVVFALAELLTRLDDHWQQMPGQRSDLVVTTGVLGIDPAEHAIAPIRGSVRFSFEVRSQSRETLDASHAL